MRRYGVLVFLQLLLTSVLVASKTGHEHNTKTNKQFYNSKRPILGGQTEQNVNDPIYIELAEESMKKYMADCGDPQPYKLVEVKKVTKQVVSGTLTRIDFDAIVGDSTGITCKSKIWEQPWLQRKDINVTCEYSNPIEKPVPGGQTEQNVNDPIYIELAEESLKKYMTDSGDPQPYKLVEVKKVTKQVVSGTLTRIDFDAIVGDSTGITCKSEIWEQPWLHRKDINVTCEYNDPYYADGEPVPGGQNGEDINDPIYKELAEESLKKYISDSGDPQPYKLVEVKKVTTQVVSGTLTRIDFDAVVGDSTGITCKSEIWEQPWLHRKDINVTCEYNDPYYADGEPVPGGQNGEDINDPIYKELAEESLKKYMSDSGDPQPYKLVEVKKVTTQVVSGTLTRIDFDAVVGDSTGITCKSKIWEQPWLQRKDINVTCEYSNPIEKPVPGGQTEQNVNDPIYIELAEESLKKYMTDSGDPQPYKLVEVKKVTKQVVSGTLTRIDFDAIVGDSTGITCKSEIWEQPWLHRKDINVTCEYNDPYYADGEPVPGGQNGEDINDPIYKELAEESLKKYISDSGDPQPYKLVEVKKVTTQVVSGTLTRIDFDAVVGDSTGITCKSEIWEQPWLHRKDINVTCEYNDPYYADGEPVPGGQNGDDINDPIYKELAEESLKKYMSDSGDPQPYKLVEVKKVTTQVVSGTLTRIDFDAVVGDSTGITCKSKIWEQPWLQRKDINVTCEYSNPIEKPVPGGQTEQNVNDPIYIELAEESLKKYMTDSGDPQPYKLVEVKKVTKQVVSGTLTRIDFDAIVGDSTSITCKSEIWEQPWLQRKDINVTCEYNDPYYADGEPVPGGQNGEDINDPIYKELAEESLKKYMTDSGDPQPYKLVEVKKVTTQVVSGTLTRIDFDAVVGDSTGITCKSEIWEQPWLHRKDINVTCEYNDPYYADGEPVPGGQNGEDINDPIYKELAEESLKKYMSDSGDPQPYKLVEVKKVTTQVVSGTLTRIDFDAVVGDSTGITCKSEIWEQPWLHQKDISVTCEYNDPYYADGEPVPGGQNEEDINDPIYKELAEESLKKYMTDSGDPQPYKLVEVKKVTKQVVSGTLTRIDFDAVVGDSTGLNCYSEIWEQPWLNTKDIKVTCYYQNCN